MVEDQTPHSESKRDIILSTEVLASLVADGGHLVISAYTHEWKGDTEAVACVDYPGMSAATGDLHLAEAKARHRAHVEAGADDA